MLNIAVLMGRLTAEPELKHLPSGVPVVSFTLAVDRSYVKAGTERVTDFINVVAWRSTAEFVTKYFHKGQLVAVQGTLQTRSYQDKDGNNRKTFEIVAESVHFAEPKKESGVYGPQEAVAGGGENTEGAAVGWASGNAEDFQEIAGDDDLPF